MTRAAELAASYSPARPRLTRIAYAILGVQAEAEDVVSDCWLRLAETDAGPSGPVHDVEAWATVAVARRSLDVLRSARVKREAYIGPWLPEPLVEPLLPTAATTDPADRVTLDETVSFALLVVLETLTPAERTAWVLHDVFGMPFLDVARAVGRSPAAVRQLAARARSHVERRTPRVSVDHRQHRAVVVAFAQATATGDLAGLVSLLDPDAVLVSDGGGQVRAARRPVEGADRVARFILGLAAKSAGRHRMQPAAVNGAPGLAVLSGDELVLVASLTVTGGKVRRVDLIMAPDKLAGVHLPEKSTEWTS